MQVGMLLFAAMTSPCRHMREAPTAFFDRVTKRLLNLDTSDAGKRAGAGAGGLLGEGSPCHQAGFNAAQDPAHIWRRLKDSKGVALHALAAVKVMNAYAHV